ncbi:hypothetical protein NSA47_13185 [Irregularibacter muris]|uniref:Uncharacterized protein n=1 Tax=Irregularibacter muris TaxID=1796619 RepID=A0AAE3L088_9FIRM|nr:hypothetical protein [Irregularibacter muris]MCR1899926.1 hypothetical protein [Irregularibacter muris]
MKINKGTKVGIIIEIIAIIIMLLLALFNKTVPSIIVWIFSIGMLIALGGSLIELSKNKRDNSRLRAP